MIGFCPSCLERRKIIGSHAIPLAFFRCAGELQWGNKPLIYTPIGTSQKVARANSTGKCKLLCEACDSKLGRELDKPAFEWATKDTQDRPKISGEVLARFVASVFWRANLSNHHFYRDFLNRRPDISNSLKRATFNPSETFILASYSAAKIQDDEISRDAMKTLIVTPFEKLGNTNLGKSFTFLRSVFGGHIWTMTMPPLLPLNDAFLKLGRQPPEIYTNFTSDPDLLLFSFGMLEKIRNNEVSVKLNITPHHNAN